MIDIKTLTPVFLVDIPDEETNLSFLAIDATKGLHPDYPVISFSGKIITNCVTTVPVIRNSEDDLQIDMIDCNVTYLKISVNSPVERFTIESTKIDHLLLELNNNSIMDTLVLRDVSIKKLTVRVINPTSDRIPGHTRVYLNGDNQIQEFEYFDVKVDSSEDTRFQFNDQEDSTTTLETVRLENLILTNYVRESQNLRYSNSPDTRIINLELKSVVCGEMLNIEHVDSKITFNYNTDKSYSDKIWHLNLLDTLSKELNKSILECNIEFTSNLTDLLSGTAKVIKSDTVLSTSKQEFKRDVLRLLAYGNVLSDVRHLVARTIDRDLNNKYIVPVAFIEVLNHVIGSIILNNFSPAELESVNLNKIPTLFINSEGQVNRVKQTSECYYDVYTSQRAFDARTPSHNQRSSQSLSELLRTVNNPSITRRRTELEHGFEIRPETATAVVDSFASAAARSMPSLGTIRRPEVVDSARPRFDPAFLDNNGPAINRGQSERTERYRFRPISPSAMTVGESDLDMISRFASSFANMGVQNNTQEQTNHEEINIFGNSED